jgi:hypothetical protein
MSTKTKEHSLQFNGAMVRAILSGEKTQTRRPLKNDLGVCDECWLAAVPHQVECFIDAKLIDSPIGFKPYIRVAWCEHNDVGGGRPCSQYAIGDTFRISEAVKVTALNDEQFQLHYQADNSILIRYGQPGLIAKIRAYKSPLLRGVNLPPAFARGERYELAGVRVERVKEISSDDAIAEGSFLDRCPCLPRTSDKRPIDKMFRQTACHIHGTEFHSLWSGIYGADAWNRDWCSAMTFGRLA